MKSLRAIACCFLALLFVFTAMNMHLLGKPLRRFLNGSTDFESLRQEIQGAYHSYGLFMKNSFVELNGFFEYVTGRRLINETLVLNNGMLTDGVFYLDEGCPEAFAKRLAGFDEALAQAGIPFLYVQAPYKLDLEKSLLPESRENDAHSKADELLSALETHQVEVLDLRERICATAEDIGRYFFRTDHHWNTQGGFEGFRLIVPALQAVLGDETDVSMYTDLSNWEEHVVREILLGSYGRRVGRYVAGIDDFAYLTPRFDTYIACEYWADPPYRREGDFEAALLHGKHLQNEGGYFGSDPYSTYVGWDSTLVKQRNEQAPVRKRLLLIKDSYMNSVQAFLSTVYQEIHVIDPRHFDQCSLLEYACDMKPDAVMMMISPPVFSVAQDYDYGEALFGIQ